MFTSKVLTLVLTNIMEITLLYMYWASHCLHISSTVCELACKAWWATYWTSATLPLLDAIWNALFKRPHTTQASTFLHSFKISLMIPHNCRKRFNISYTMSLFYETGILWIKPKIMVIYDSMRYDYSRSETLSWDGTKWKDLNK